MRAFIKRFKGWIIGLVLACAFAFLIIQESFVSRGHDDTRLHCAFNLHLISLAIINYHDAYGRLPPAAITSKDGKPLLSWRVSLLPFVEEQSLYPQFHLDEPWDSPHNLQLLDEMPYDYGRFVADQIGMTHYQVVVGPGTAFEKDGLTWKDFPDGRSNTILIVEAAEGVPWTKPVDLQYDPTAPVGIIGNYHQKSIHFSRYTLGAHQVFNAAFADGSVHSFRKEKDPESLRGFLTRNGGETLDWSLVD